MDQGQTKTTGPKSPVLLRVTINSQSYLLNYPAHPGGHLKPNEFARVKKRLSGVCKAIWPPELRLEEQLDIGGENAQLKATEKKKKRGTKVRCGG